MKKFITIILGLVLALSMCATASAATVTETGDTELNVYAKYNDAATTPDVISVDLTWGAMRFTYSETGNRTWNPNTHKYTDTTASWDADGTNTVKVTNHSNVAITAKLTCAIDSKYSGLGYKFYNVAANYPKTINLATAVGTAVADAPTGTAELSLTGTPPATLTTFAKVGTITVNLAKK